MPEEKKSVGRPRVENPLTEAQRSKRYRRKKKQVKKEKDVCFWMSEVDQQNLAELMSETGFGEKEKSEFLSTLLILLNDKEYLGDTQKFKAVFKRAEQAL